MPPQRTRRTLVALAVLTLSLPVATGVAGALPAEPPPDWDTAEIVELPEEPEAVLMPSDAYPGVDGVDLLALGYQGDPLDASLLDRIGQPLPEDDQARVDEIAIRLAVGGPQRDGLAEAERLLQAAVDQLGPDVDQLRSALAVAQRHEAEAVDRATDAETRLASRTSQLATHRQDMAEVAVAAYVNPPDADVLAQVLGNAATTTSDLSAGVLFAAKADHDGLVRDELEVSIAVARERLAEAEVVAATAGDRTDSTSRALASARERADAHRTALAMVEAALATIEEQLPVLKADMDATIEKLLKELEEAWKQIRELMVGDLSVLGSIPVTIVKGIRIHPAIAPRLNALLEHAHADGVPLGGWGHRTTESQINLRRKHCGPTPFDIFEKKASECSPPTARPGKSMHERGLAVDFHLAGRSISTRSSPGYQWLAEHAATYGFYNLPSEPWHWSVNAK
jgi:D-alanyl-D-alanine carboxypeptidase